MKKLLLLIAFAVTLQGFAQQLPDASPRSIVSQRVGLTDIELNYSRPSVKSRDIFGGLVPFGKHWRLGANKNSTISFSTDARFGRESIPAGTYSITAIVNEMNWIIILNSKNDMWGIDDGYNSRQDVVRFTAPVKTLDAPVESLYMGIEDLTQETANLIIAWEKSSVKIPIALETITLAEENLQIALNENPEDFKIKRTAARFYMQNDLNMSEALLLITQVVKNNPESWYNNYLFAQVMAKMGDPKSAKDAAKKAMLLGRKDSKEKGEKFYYQDDIKSFMKTL
jgi:tetratricopeptide (TPR) repeat protein